MQDAEEFRLDGYGLPSLTPRDYWETPQSIVDAISAIMGSPPFIDLCATRANAKAEYYVGERAHELPGEPNGLGNLFSMCPEEIARMSQGRWNWLNPPYSDGNLPLFTAWAAEFARAGGTVALLVPASQSDGWWRRNVAPFARMILVPDRRIQFLAPAGVQPSTNSGQNAIVIMSKARAWDGDAVTRRLHMPAHRAHGRTNDQ